MNWAERSRVEGLLDVAHGHRVTRRTSVAFLRGRLRAGVALNKLIGRRAPTQTDALAVVHELQRRLVVRVRVVLDVPGHEGDDDDGVGQNVNELIDGIGVGKLRDPGDLVPVDGEEVNEEEHHADDRGRQDGQDRHFVFRKSGT